MQQESLRNEKDIKSTYYREEKAFTCGENHFITRKRNNYNYSFFIQNAQG